MPKNASINAGGFRIYDWPGGDTPLNQKYNAVEPAQLLSVTSIRTLAGEPFQLSAWKISNVVSVAMGTRKVPAIGKRGRPLKNKTVIAKDGPFPGEFVTRMLETKGSDEGLNEVNTWLREQADQPRNVAAVRGSVVHKMIEMGLTMAVVDEDVIRARFAAQWAEEKMRVRPEVTMEDVAFAEDGLANYWAMRERVPFVIVAQEPQVFNLSAGYAGSADAFIWFLGNFQTRSFEAIDDNGQEYMEDETIFVPLPDADKMMPRYQKEADAKRLTAETIESVGGQVTVGDWKTSKGVYTNHVVQTTAYIAGEFVAEDGIIDERLTDILSLAMLGMVIHIRPDKWAVDVFEFRQDCLGAFLGSVRFARFLAFHQKPDKLFVYTLSGKAEGVVEEDTTDEAA